MDDPDVSVFDPLFRDVSGGDIEIRFPRTPESAPLLRLLGEAFEDRSVDISERSVDGERVVELVRDGECVATSPLGDVMDTFLLVNSDLYRTGTSGVDRYEAPAVLTELDEMVFTMRGFPDSTKQKLLLILISRFIENRALTAGNGRLDAAFQQLSRLNDENGTREVYARLADSGVDTHIYGVPDAEPLACASATRHTGDGPRYRHTWFVVYSDPDGDRSAALVAVEFDDNAWRGVWSYREAFVEETRRILDTAF